MYCIQNKQRYLIVSVVFKYISVRIYVFAFFYGSVPYSPYPPRRRHSVEKKKKMTCLANVNATLS